MPSNKPEFKRLCQWCGQQRTVWKGIQSEGKKPRSLTLSQFKRLEEIGFDFGSTASRETLWEEDFAALLEYKNRYGDCNVPADSPEHSRLASWVKVQRATSEKLTKERTQRLTDLGFIWSLHEQKWQNMYKELVKYKQQKGDFDVPKSWAECPGLASWVSSQRTAKKSGKLPAYRQQLLDDLGFIWQKNKSTLRGGESLNGPPVS